MGMTLNIYRHWQAGNMRRKTLNMNCYGRVISAKPLNPHALLINFSQDILFKFGNISVVIY